MKKLAILAIVCCSVILSSCFRPQETYNASISEWHIANNDNLVSIKAVLGTIHSFWDGDYAYKGLTSDMSDLKAEARFLEADAAIILNSNKFEQYMEPGDYFIYTLKRTSGGEFIMIQEKFIMDEDGLSNERIYYYND